MKIRHLARLLLWACLSCLPPGMTAAVAGEPGKGDVAALLEQAGQLGRQGRYDEAAALAQQALQQAEAAKAEPAIVAALVLQLGLQTARFEFDAAEATGKRAYALADKVFGTRLPFTGVIAMNLANLYTFWGRPAQAEPWTRRALAAMEAIDRNGSLHGTALEMQASAERAIGQTLDARQHLEQALAIQEKQSKGRSPRLAARYVTLAELRGQLGDAAGRQAAYARALELQQARPPAELDGSDLVALARTHRALGHEADADAAFERAQAWAAASEAERGGAAPAPGDIAARLRAEAPLFAWREIGRYEQERGQLAAAEQALRRAIALSERLDGPDNTNLPRLQMQLAEVLQARGDAAAAEALYAGALAALDQRFGRTHADMPAALEGLARARLARGEPALALPPLERAIAYVDTWVSPRHPQLAALLDLQARALAATGRDTDAQAARERAATLQESRP